MVEMKIDVFTYSEWFGNQIFISPNNNIYGLYSFDKGSKVKRISVYKPRDNF